MSGFVIDASVALAWCFDDEATEATRALLDRFEDGHAEVPSLWHLELANALAMGERKGRITPARASEFIALIDALPIVIDERTPSVALNSVLEFESEGIVERLRRQLSRTCHAPRRPACYQGQRFGAGG